MAMYRSTLIIHRVMIEPVHAKTSHEIHKSHTAGPQIQTFLIWLAAANGISNAATAMSDIAKLMMRKLGGLRSLRSRHTDKMTSIFPKRVKTMTVPVRSKIKTVAHGEYGGSSSPGKSVPFPGVHSSESVVKSPIVRKTGLLKPPIPTVHSDTSSAASATTLAVN